LALIAGVFLALLSLAVVLYPFITLRRGSRQVHQEDTLSDNEATQTTLEDIYAAIETLRLEHQLGNIPTELYQEQLLGYRMEAAEALRRQSESGASGSDFLLEQEILAARLGVSEPDRLKADCPENRVDC
jgi:hypothetical protein